jgi:hypothetical protein
MKKILLLLLALYCSNVATAQYGYRDGNRIGISGGITQLSLLSSNFKAKPGTGWIAGLSVRGNYYNDFSMIFGMHFTESTFSLETINTSFKKEDVKYTLSGVQVRLLMSYNLVEDHVSLDFGPVLQVNGKLRIDNENKDNLISGTALKAEDIVDVTTINGNLYLGISAGGRVVRVLVFYQYGLNSIMNKLNKDDDLRALNNGDKFKGNIGLLSGQLLISL